MRKSLLTFVLLAFVIVAGAANQTVSLKKATRLSKTAPVALTQHKKVHGQKLASSLNAPRKDDVAAKDTIDITFTSEDYTFKWYDGEDTSFWYFGCFDDSGNWILRLAYNTETQLGTVNYSDMNHDYSYLDYSNYEESVFKQVTFQEGSQVNIAKDELNVTITGCLIGDDGNVYRINTTCPVPQPKTYDIEGDRLTMASFDEDWGQWDIRFKNDDWKISLSVKGTADTFAKTYTIDDDADGCYAEDLNEDEDYAFTEMTVTTTLPEGVTDPSKGCEITGTAKDANGNTFNFHMKKDAPIEPKEVKNVEVEVTTAEWPSDMTGGSYYELKEKGTDNTWKLYLTEKTGECTAEQFGGIDTTMTCRTTAAGEEIHVNNGFINQTFDVEKLEVAIDASLVMNDSIQYIFSFTTPVSKDGEETLTFTDLQADYSYYEYGPIELNASNDSIALSAEIQDYGEIPGEYTSDNFAIGLNIYKEGEEYSTYVGSNAIVYAKTELAEDGTPVLHAKFLGDNKILYTIEANYVKPEIKDTLTYNLDCNYFGNDETGYAFNYDDDSTQVWVKVMCGTNSPVGHYDINGISENSVVRQLLANGMPKAYYFCDASFDVTRDGKTYTLTGKGQAGPHFVYLTMKAEMEGLDYDSYEEDVDVAFSQADFVEATAYEEDGSSYVYVKLLNKERNDELCLVVFPEEFNGATIPAGDYDIASWGWGNWIQAGQPDYEGNIYPSYYAKLDAEGYVQAPLWFLNTGTMTVTEGDDATAFEINAKNSYGQKVHATFSIANTATGINAVNADAQNWNAFKFVKNGNVIIRKAGVEYNAAGQRK